MEILSTANAAGTSPSEKELPRVISVFNRFLPPAPSSSSSSSQGNSTNVCRQHGHGVPSCIFPNHSTMHSPWKAWTQDGLGDQITTSLISYSAKQMAQQFGTGREPLGAGGGGRWMCVWAMAVLLLLLLLLPMLVSSASLLVLVLLLLLLVLVLLLISPSSASFIKASPAPIVAPAAVAPSPHSRSAPSSSPCCCSCCCCGGWFRRAGSASLFLTKSVSFTVMTTPTTANRLLNRPILLSGSSLRASTLLLSLSSLLASTLLT
mmetsp:Transcript_36985/g.81011  ORF Transcript_36985/g.81011 Transcript_36985/m.81011 type:complete len:263 (-) Transcript_36985:114-902(-)